MTTKKCFCVLHISSALLLSRPNGIIRRSVCFCDGPIISSTLILLCTSPLFNLRHTGRLHLPPSNFRHLDTLCIWLRSSEPESRPAGFFPFLFEKLHILLLVGPGASGSSSAFDLLFRHIALQERAILFMFELHSSNSPLPLSTFTSPVEGRLFDAL